MAREEARTTVCAVVSYVAGSDALQPHMGLHLSEVLARMCRCPRAVFAGLAAARTKNQAACRASLVALANGMHVPAGRATSGELTSPSGLECSAPDARRRSQRSTT